MSSAEIYERCTLGDNKAAFHVMVCGMAKDGEILRHPAPEGSGAGVRFVYGPPSSKASAPAAASKPRARRTEGFMAKKRARAKSQPPAAAAAANGRKSAAVVVPVRISAAEPAPAHRWAFTNDGAFLLLGSPVEIRGAAARALVDFVRALDGAQA